MYKKNRNILIAIVMSLFVLFLTRNNLSVVLESFQTSTLRNIMEFVYFLSSPLILIVALIGLRQISLAKEKMNIDAKRESYRLAVEQCEKYAQEIIPLLNDLDEYMDDKNIKSLGDTNLKINGKQVEIRNKVIINLSSDSELVNRITNVLNKMEAFSVFFIAGVAEESVAFESLGSTFSHSVRMLLPVICSVNGYGYANVFKLYLLWKQKFDKNKALKEKIQAEKKMNEEFVVDVNSIGLD